MAQPSFTVAVAEELLEHAARAGVDVRPFRERVGLGPSGLSPLDARISAAKLLRLWEELPRACSDPDFGLSFAASIAKPTSNLATLLVASASTLGEGITRFLAHERAFNDLLPTALEHDRVEARIVLDPARVAMELPLSRHVTEAVLAWWWRMIGHGLAAAPVARRVELVHPLPPHGTAAHRNAFGVEPGFERPRNVLAFDAELLRRPLVSHSPRLRVVAEQATQQLLQAVSSRDDDPIAGIREQIVHALERGELPSQAAVARVLGVSARTLQRMLGTGRTTFTALVDETRCAEARRLLRETTLPMQDVARRLGYYDPAGFFRAFKRWTGMTPGDFRRQEPSPRTPSPDAPATAEASPDAPSRDRSPS